MSAILKWQHLYCKNAMLMIGRTYKYSTVINPADRVLVIKTYLFLLNTIIAIGCTSVAVILWNRFILAYSCLSLTMR